MSTLIQQKPNINAAWQLSCSKLAEESTHTRHGRKARFFPSTDRKIIQEHFTYVKIYPCSADNNKKQTTRDQVQ